MIEALILTGFLGSGKTTLLGRLLRRPEFSRTAVIINEFGEIGLDHDLIEASEDSLIELQTGCLCCKIRNDLATTIHDLLRRRDEGAVAPFTRIVIETSGLADPAPILQTLMTDAAIAERVVLGGVVTTVDAVNGADTLDREEISAKQVAVADRLLLTKTDLAARRPHCMRRLDRAQCDGARADRPTWRDRPPRSSDGRLYDPLTKSLDVRSWLGPDPGAHAHHHGHDGIEHLRHCAPRTLAGGDADAFSRDARRALRRRSPPSQRHREHPGKPRAARRHSRRPARVSSADLAARLAVRGSPSRMIFITRGIPRGWVEALLAALDAEVAEVSAGLSI